MKHYLESLPEWDGHDHIADLLGMVHCRDCPPADFDFYVRRWLVAMVAATLDDSVVNHQIFVLLGPQGTGLLLCRTQPAPIRYGGTGSRSRDQTMPEDLPDRLEAGTLNAHGLAGLNAGVRYLLETGIDAIREKVAQYSARKFCFIKLDVPPVVGCINWIMQDYVQQ